MNKPFAESPLIRVTPKILEWLKEKQDKEMTRFGRKPSYCEILTQLLFRPKK